MSLISHWGSWIPKKQSHLLAPHKDQGLEIIYVARGEIEWVYDGQPVYSTPGSLVMSWPWEEHGIPVGPAPQSEIYWVILNLDHHYPQRVEHPRIPAELAMDPETEAWVIQSLMQCTQKSFKASRLSAELIKQAILELNTPSPGHRSRIRGIVNLLLLEMAKLAEQPPAPVQPAGSKERVQRFLKDLEENCAEEWTLERMAEAGKLGRTRFTLLVSEITGDSPLRLLNRYRVNKAKKLLREKPYTITQIGFDCGFNSSQYFSKVFREFSGKTPSQWRREIQSK